MAREKNEAADAAKAIGNECDFSIGDASNEGTVVTAIELAVEKFGSLDGLHHVAGCSGRKKGDGPLHDSTLEGWNFTLEQNLTSVYLSNSAAVQKFFRT